MNGGADYAVQLSAMLTVLFLAACLAADTGKITGTVVEARTGTPLAAVLVKVQATGQQALSDADGRFEIDDVPVGAQTLLVSVVRGSAGLP